MILDDKAININLLQEECAELIQALSKLRRFPIDFTNPIDGVMNRDALITEIGDVLVFLEAIANDYEISDEEIGAAMTRKHKKLEKYYRT